MKVYVSNYLSKSISIIDYDSLTLENEIKLDENIYPHHFCIDKETKKMYLPSSSNGILYILDMNSEKIIDSSSIGGSLSQIAMYKEEIFIANEDSNSIYFMDKNTLDPIGMISVDDMPHGFCFDLPRKKLYVPCMDSITCIDIINKFIEKIDSPIWMLIVTVIIFYMLFAITFSFDLRSIGTNILNEQDFFTKIESNINYESNSNADGYLLFETTDKKYVAIGYKKDAKDITKIHILKGYKFIDINNIEVTEQEFRIANIND